MAIEKNKIIFRLLLLLVPWLYSQKNQALFVQFTVYTEHQLEQLEAVKLSEAATKSLVSLFSLFFSRSLTTLISIVAAAAAGPQWKVSASSRTRPAETEEDNRIRKERTIILFLSFRPDRSIKHHHHQLDSSLFFVRVSLPFYFINSKTGRASQRKKERKKKKSVFLVSWQRKVSYPAGIMESPYTEWTTSGSSGPATSSSSSSFFLSFWLFDCNYRAVCADHVSNAGQAHTSIR